MDNCNPNRSKIHQFEIKRYNISDKSFIGFVDEGFEENQCLLMLHGMGGNLAHWEPLIVELSSNYRCIALDLPGYGYSTKYGSFPDNLLDDWSKQLFQFIKKFIGHQVILVGNSMGGQLAMLMAHQYRDWVSGLILINPAGFEVFESIEKEILRSQLNENFYAQLNRQEVQVLFAANFFKMPDSAHLLIDERLSILNSEENKYYARLYERAIRSMLDREVREYLPNLKLPVYVFFGSEDQLIPHRKLHAYITLDEIAKVSYEMPRAELKMIPYAGHIAAFERPEIIAEEIKKKISNKKVLTN
jgi:pimeloyl-ACP methyl ester carboxylesterase